MADKLEYQGIAIKLDRLGERRWRWEISPPKCVLGMQDKVGVVDGDQIDAVHAARSAIESQSASARP